MPAVITRGLTGVANQISSAPTRGASLSKLLMNARVPRGPFLKMIHHGTVGGGRVSTSHKKAKSRAHKKRKTRKQPAQQTATSTMPAKPKRATPKRKYAKKPKSAMKSPTMQPPLGKRFVRRGGKSPYTPEEEEQIRASARATADAPKLSIAAINAMNARMNDSRRMDNSSTRTSMRSSNWGIGGGDENDM